MDSSLRIEVIRQIIMKIGDSEGKQELSQALNHLLDRVSRLEFLLWGKTGEYEGPLYNGYQENEWIGIATLVGKWLVESYSVVVKIKDANVKEAVEQFYDPKHVAQLSRTIIIELIKGDLIEMDETKEKYVMFILENEIVSALIEGDIGEVLNQIKTTLEEVCCSCFSNKNNIKKATAMIENHTMAQGSNTTSVNKVFDVLLKTGLMVMKNL